MRFEIRASGLILILLCVLGASAVVFFLGMIAGHGIANQEQAAQDAAPVYPLPSPPPGIATPAPAMSEAAANPAQEATAAPGTVSASSSKSSGAGSAPKASAIAALKAPAVGTNPNASRKSAETAAEEKPDIAAVATPTPAARHKNYSVQIEAVMDQQGAYEMVAKLKRLGYLPYLVATDIGGQTWYRVRVGPYATAEEAKEVEIKLHQEYGGSSSH
jgi:cell division septation protein DedD